MAVEDEAPVERVYLRGDASGTVLVTKPSRSVVDAPEPGTYRDPFTGKLRWEREKSKWWGNLLDRYQR